MIENAKMEVTLNAVVIFLLLWVSKIKTQELPTPTSTESGPDPTTPPPISPTPNPVPVTQTPPTESDPDPTKPPPISTSPNPVPMTQTPPTSSTPATFPGTPQDTKDAQTIINSKMKEDVVASILVYREKIHRIAINQQITAIDVWKPLIGDYYLPTNSSNPVFFDLCFGLVKDETIVLSTYLSLFFECKDETWIIIALVLTKNMQAMIAAYDLYHGGKFGHMQDEQRHPFQNMIKVWCAQNREEDEQGVINQHNAFEDAKILKAEQDHDGWHHHRDQLENILMKKSLKYAQVVIQEFEKANEGKAIEDIIKENISRRKLNYDLADAYSSLARYIKNKYKYIADIMREYCDGTDRWAAWIMCIAVVDSKEWPKVNDAFKQGNSNESLGKFIMGKNIDDKVMAEMMAAITDPTFKPTTFAKSSAPGGLGLLISTPPPVTPTMVASAPASSTPSALTPASKPTPPTTAPSVSAATPAPLTTPGPAPQTAPAPTPPTHSTTPSPTPLYAEK